MTTYKTALDLIPSNSCLSCPDLVAVEYTNEDLKRWRFFHRFLLKHNLVNIELNDIPSHEFWVEVNGGWSPTELPFHTGGNKTTQISQDRVVLHWEDKKGLCSVWAELLYINADNTIGYKGKRLA